LEVDWERDGDQFKIKIELPPNTRATLHLPVVDAESVRESGQPAAAARGVRFLRHQHGQAHYELGSGACVSHSRLP
jgi:alpha-L-rhamnosidase